MTCATTGWSPSWSRLSLTALTARCRAFSTRGFGMMFFSSRYPSSSVCMQYEQSTLISRVPTAAAAAAAATACAQQRPRRRRQQQQNGCYPIIIIPTEPLAERECRVPSIRSTALRLLQKLIRGTHVVALWRRKFKLRPTHAQSLRCGG